MKIEQNKHLSDNDESDSLDDYSEDDSQNSNISFETDNKIEKINSSIFNDTKIDLKSFNNMEGEDQKSFFNNSKFDNSQFNRIKNLFTYLSNEYYKSTKEKQKFNFIFFQKAFANTYKNDNSENNNVDLMIGIGNNMIELLYEYGNLDSKEFSDQIGKCSKIIIEIRYPLINFDSIIQKIINLKSSYSNILKIKTFIIGIEFINQKFYRNKNVDFIQIDSCVKRILSNEKKGSFKGCSSMKEIMIPSSVSEMRNNVFRGCCSLEKIEISSSIHSISYNLFIGCTKLKQITLPSTLKYIGSYAFKNVNY